MAADSSADPPSASVGPSIGVRIADAFAGAPLDSVKACAALLMVADHVNAVFLGNQPTVWWHVGRIVFPLFAFALVCNLARGVDVARYLTSLLVLGVIAQPFYAGALAETDGNTIFTLAAGIAVAFALRDRPPLLQHGAFVAGAAALFTPAVQARTGLDFGLAGMLLPAALYLVLNGSFAHLPWLILTVIGLNWFQPEPWRYAPLATAGIAAGGTVLIALLSLSLRGRPRFLPRYALHVFYPAHFLLLGALQLLPTATR